MGLFTWPTFVAVLEEDGFNPEHPYFYCFVAERSLEDSGDAVVPNNSGEFSDIGNKYVYICMDLYVN